MRIEEYADAINASLLIRRYPNQDNRYSCSFDKCEIKEGSFLRGAFGNGKSAHEAIQNYARQISGQYIVFNAFGDDRREMQVPILAL